MAGLTWFEQDIDFFDHPKTIALRALLKNPLAEAYVSRVWAYCYRYATDRFSGAAAEATVEQAARWKGKDGALVSALLEVRYLEQDGDDLVAHGVQERLAPHLAKRERDATRARERRDEVAKSVGHPGGVAATSARRPRDVSGDRDRDKDRDLSEITIVSDLQPTRDPPPPTAREAGGGLERVQARLAAELGVPRIGTGRKTEHVAASFSRWLDRGLEDELLEECLRIAHEKGVTPGHLSWWAGWLDTVSDAELERLAAQLHGKAAAL